MPFSPAQNPQIPFSMCLQDAVLAIGLWHQDRQGPAVSPCRYVAMSILFMEAIEFQNVSFFFGKFQEILHEDSFKVRILSIWKDCERQDVALLEGVDAILGKLVPLGSQRPITNP